MVGVRCACKGNGVDASGTVCPCACKAWRVVNFCCLSTSGLINLCLLYKIFASGVGCVSSASPVVYLVRKSAVCLVELYISAYNDKVSGFVGRFQFPACSRGCTLCLECSVVAACRRYVCIVGIVHDVELAVGTCHELPFCGIGDACNACHVGIGTVR